MADTDNLDFDRRARLELLLQLKKTAEGLLAAGNSNVWGVYGGLDRLCSNVENILCHRLKITQGPKDYWSFVLGIKRLRPDMIPFFHKFNNSFDDNNKHSEGQSWIYYTIEHHMLSHQLQILVNASDHLHQFYYDDSFLCNKEYYGAMLTCLRAVEQNKPSLLADIDPILLRLGTGPTGARPTGAGDESSLLRRTSTSPIMIRRKSSQDRLAPPFISPSRDGGESILSTSEEHAKPVTIGSNSPDGSLKQAKTALLQVLEKAGDSAVTETTNSELSNSNEVINNLELHLSNHLIRRVRRHSLDSCDDLPTHSRRRLSLGDNIEDTLSCDKNDASCDKNIAFHETKLTAENDNSLNDISNKTEPVSAIDCIANTKYCDNNTLNVVSSSSVGAKLEDVPESPVLGNKNGANNKVQTASKPTKKKTHHRSRSEFTFKSQNSSTSPPWKSTDEGVFCSSLPAVPPVRRHSMIDEGLQSPLSEYSLPRPMKGQSLRSFLSSQDFHTCADVDKENAHFMFSEAMIAAIEQIKCNEELNPHPHSSGTSSEEEQPQQPQQQRIRIRKIEKVPRRTTRSSTQSSIFESASESASSSDVEDAEITDDASNLSNLSTLNNTGLSLSLASLYSDADIHKELANQNDDKINGHISTAETIAISLLKKFSERQLPKASDLVWLISEQEAPQELLPLPNSIPVSPDDAANNQKRALQSQKTTRIRGNLEWAPPRPQIIFNIHPTIKRKELVAKQNFFCAGCGCKIDLAYMKRFRYCEYLGKLFCQCCHTNATAYIPARILQKWDFYKYYVSNFAQDLLKKIDLDPLFNIDDINPMLYKRQKVLEFMRECRLQLFHIRGFLQTCRAGHRLWEQFRNLPVHWHNDPDLYSLNDLVKVKNGELLPQLRNLVIESICHISECQLCQAKGFICEICNNDKDLLFPFELSRVTSCIICRTCFHQTCFVPGNCPKCRRIEARRKSLAAVLSSSEDESDESTNEDDDNERERCSTMIEVYREMNGADSSPPENDSSSPQER